MCNKKIIILLINIFIPLFMIAQNNRIEGMVYDENNNPIESATVILQTLDSIYRNVAFTDSSGAFGFNEDLPSYRLVIQHILYQTKEIDSPINNRIIHLKEKENILSAVTITGERPLVKMIDGKLTYDVEQIIRNRAVSNAYDALLALPGVVERNGTVSLSGTEGTTLILNGKPTTMSSAQMIELLKQMPASYIEKAEVMYSAPPQYHVRGAAINLVINRISEKTEKPVLQGELAGGYTQRHYANYSTGSSLLYGSKKVSVDFLYSFADLQLKSEMDILSRHTMDGTVYNIEQHNSGKKEVQTHTGRLGIDYKPNEKNTISFVYNTLIHANGRNREYSSGNLSESTNFNNKKQQMHNWSLDYNSGLGFTAGVNYTYFKAPSRQHFSETDNSGKQNTFISDARQKIDAVMLYIDRAHSLGNNWKFTYGAKYNYAKDYDYQIFSNIPENSLLHNTDNTIKEYIYDLYAGMSKSFSDYFSMDLSLTGEYYILAQDREWSLFPQAQLTYMKSSDNIFQLSVSSNKQYPNYWEKQNYTGFFNGYAEVRGNPSLKPYNSYQTQLSYINKQKYIFTLYYIYQPDYSMQLAYQSPDRLSIIYQTLNWDFNRIAGLNVVIPFNAGNRLSSRLTLNGFYQQSKSDSFYDISFNNKKFIAYSAIDNTMNISSKPNVKMEISGYYMTKPIQGIYDLSEVYSINAGLKWIFSGQKAELRFRATDILDSSIPNIYVRNSRQNFDMFMQEDSRRMEISFTYKFGGYKAKQRKDVDSSRFGH